MQESFQSIRAATFFIVCLTLMLTCSPVVSGQEFRIETSVYDDTSSLPVSQKVTLFSQGIVYEFQLSNDAQPTTIVSAIYDSRNRTMILLDPGRKVRLELSDLRLLKILEAVRNQTVQDNRTSFLVEDSFTEDIDHSTNWVTLTSPQIEYRFHGSQPRDVLVLQPYFEFLERITQVNASDPEKIQPFPRLKLNESIRNLGWIPDEIRISVKQNSLFKQSFTAKSKHVLIHQLSDQDHARIAAAKQNWMLFKKVDLTEYRGLEKNRFEFPGVLQTSYEEPVEGRK